MGNGAKAAQKRERNVDKNSKGGATSQAKTNKAAMNIICQKCKQSFFSTTREPALTEHALNKHSKELKDCFPGFSESA